MNVSRKIISIAFATLVALPAFAGDDLPPWEKQKVASRTVQFGDLDLATPAGQKVLTKRVKRAARQVCDEIEPFEPGRRLSHIECVSELTDNTLAKLPDTLKQPAQRVAGGIKVQR